MLQITKIKLTNIMGLENFKLEPGKLTVISGKNAAGKSSMATAFDSILDGGAHKSTLLRDGAEEGRIVFEIEDESGNEIQIDKKVGKDSSSISVKENGKTVKKPVEIIQKLLNKASANPISFFTATKEKRKEIILKAMPVELDSEKLLEITGQKVSVSGNAFEILKAIRKGIYDERTATNRSIKEKENSINQVKAALPQNVISESVDVDSINAQLIEIESNKQKSLLKIKTHLEKLKGVSDSTIDQIKENAESEIKELEARINEIRKDANEEIQANKESFAESKRKATEAESAKNEEARLAKIPLEDALRNAKANIENQGRLKQTLENIESWENECKDLVETSETQSKALIELDDYKDSLIKNLPIQGLSIDGDDVLYNGIAWDALNEAKRMELAFKIAKLQTADLPFMFVDGAERLDSDNFELFKKNALESGIQCVLFEVSRSAFDGLNVEVLG